METYLLERLMKYMPQLLDFVRKNCHMHIDGGNLNLADSCIRLLVSLVSRVSLSFFSFLFPSLRGSLFGP